MSGRRCRCGLMRCEPEAEEENRAQAGARRARVPVGAVRIHRGGALPFGRVAYSTKDTVTVDPGVLALGPCSGQRACQTAAHRVLIRQGAERTGLRWDYLGTKCSTRSCHKAATRESVRSGQGGAGGAEPPDRPRQSRERSNDRYQVGSSHRSRECVAAPSGC